jgi:hypothetical protein
MKKHQQRQTDQQQMNTPMNANDSRPAVDPNR